MTESAAYAVDFTEEKRGAEMRKAIENMKGARCSKCGGKASIVVRKANGGETQSVTYCKRCHNDITARKRRIINLLNQ